MNAVLVAGGAGYIGSHICKLLAKKGLLPVAIDNLSRGHEWAVKWGPLYVGDLRDEKFLSEVFAKHQFSAVMNFAAYAYVGEPVCNPILYYDNNVIGGLSLLRTCVAHGVENFIFSSTCATYGEPEKMPIDEWTPQNPVNPYGHSKLMIEQALRDVVHATSLAAKSSGASTKFRVAVLRYFNAAGADPDGEIGEHHDHETHLIPLTIAAAYGGPMLMVHGKDYPTPDGTCLRDYVHVNDLGQAHLLALEWLSRQSKSIFEPFNLGTGHGYSVLEIIQAIEKNAGVKVSYRFGPRRPGDPPRLVATGDRAKQVLGWRPTADLANIVMTADRWYRRLQARTGE